MSWLWHGFNRDPIKRTNQCYHEWHCVVCWFRTLISIIVISRRLRRAA